MPKVVLYVPAHLYRALDEDVAKIRKIAREALENANYQQAVSEFKENRSVVLPSKPSFFLQSGKKSYAPDWK